MEAQTTNFHFGATASIGIVDQYFIDNGNIRPDLQAIFENLYRNLVGYEVSFNVEYLMSNTSFTV